MGLPCDEVSVFMVLVLLNSSSCAQHSEAKQIEMSEFGAEKGLLKVRAGRTGGKFGGRAAECAAFL